jgi:putative ABC transport system permease protein
VPFTAPRLADALLRRALPAEDAEVITGDLEEMARVSIEPRHGTAAARRWYWGQALSIVIARHTRTADSYHVQQKRMTMAAFRQDLSYAVRCLRRQPAFTTMAVAMLALGIGASVAIFALMHAVMLKPLPFADPDRLMLVHLVGPRPGEPAPRQMIWSYPKYRVFRENQRTFVSTAAFSAWNWNLTGTNSPERLAGEMVEGSYFDVLGLEAPLGRGFSSAETRSAGSTPLVVLGHRIWTERFGAGTDVLGGSLGLNGIPHTIVGVMPAGFRGLTGQADLWVPVTTLSAADLEEKWNHSYYVVARRKDDVAPAQAVADVQVIGDLVHAQIGYPGEEAGVPWSATAAPLDDERTDPLIRRSILLMMGAVVSVLLIVCINLANLTLVRGLARQRDVAIRFALGASRLRIVRQFMTESALLAAMGAVAAMGVAYGLLSAGAALMPDLRAVLPRGFGAASGLTRVGLGRLGLDGATLVFTLVAAAAAAIMFGLVPAWRASRRDLTSTIKAGSSGSLAPGARGFSGRNLLILGEMALALVLLTAGGLMLKSVGRLHATELGFNPRSLLSVRIALPAIQYNAQRATQFLEQLVDRLAVRGDLEAVAYGSCAPVQGGCNGTTATFPDRPAPADDNRPVVGVLWASPAYFETLGIRLVRGRVFNEQDRVGQPKVVVINETAARELWRGEDPIGKRIGVGQGGFGDGAEVVGVVADVRYGTVDGPAASDVYLPLLQSMRASGVIFVRSRAAAASVVAIVRSEVQALDPDLPLTDIRMMEERVDEATWRTRISAWLLGSFAALALLLVALGVYGVVSQGVQQRTREIGVRLAMGAARRDILGLIIGRLMWIVGAGIVLGIALAVPAMTLLTTLLYEVSPGDPWVLAPLGLLLLTVALLAGYIPARRATRLDPLTTLRAE